MKSDAQPESQPLALESPVGGISPYSLKAQQQHLSDTSLHQSGKWGFTGSQSSTRNLSYFDDYVNE